MVKAHLTIGLLPLLSFALAQQSSTGYVDPRNGITFQGMVQNDYGITIGAVFPPLLSSGAQSTEFIGEIVAPISTGYIGIAIGGHMVGDLLIVAWPNGNSTVASTRYANGRAQPGMYSGPVLTNLPSTSVNATHWNWVFRCQNCTSWTGGSLNTTVGSQWGWAYSRNRVNKPSSPSSDFQRHDDSGHWIQDLPSAHASAADYASYLAGSSTGATTRKASSTTTNATTTSFTTPTGPTSTATATITSSTIPALPVGNVSATLTVNPQGMIMSTAEQAAAKLLALAGGP
ncbi:iron reductase domain protein [Auriscalpium vulgare]|uniref:Iron reductase domain protein n=1 Tax=Auriscalpium vulgare TaxID=40419 RepID=A0ACB8RTN3_9AGAM|nr:iron reductase domain protein [Auriscalpium vulgare]